MLPPQPPREWYDVAQRVSVLENQAGWAEREIKEIDQNAAPLKGLETLERRVETLEKAHEKLKDAVAAVGWRIVALIAIQIIVVIGGIVVGVVVAKLTATPVSHP